MHPAAPPIARQPPHAVDEQLTDAVALAMGRMGGEVCSQVIRKQLVNRHTWWTAVDRRRVFGHGGVGWVGVQPCLLDQW